MQNRPFPEYRGDIDRWARDVKRHVEVMQVDLVEDVKKTTEVWDDLRFPPSAVRINPGIAKPADFVNYKTGAAIDFTEGNDSEIQITAQLPHAWKQGSDIEFHLHWATPSDATGVVRFDFSYTWVNINGDITGATGISGETTLAAGADTTVADYHRYLDIGDMTGEGKTLSSMIIGTLARDTGVADNMAESVYLLEADFHYIKDTNGSREELVK